MPVYPVHPIVNACLPCASYPSNHLTRAQTSCSRVQCAENAARYFHAKRRGRVRGETAFPSRVRAG